MRYPQPTPTYLYSPLLPLLFLPSSIQKYCLFKSYTLQFPLNDFVVTKCLVDRFNMNMCQSIIQTISISVNGLFLFWIENQPLLTNWLYHWFNPVVTCIFICIFDQFQTSNHQQSLMYQYRSSRDLGFQIVGLI